MTDVSIVPGRPAPLDDIAHDVTAGAGLGGAVVAALVSGGIIGVSRGSVLSALLGLIPGFITLITTAYAARHVATKGAEQVTPLSSPMDNQQRKLIPASGGFGVRS